MPLCRYMDHHEFEAVCESMDKELRELSDEIFQLTGRRYAVERREYHSCTRFAFFWQKKATRVFYTVLVEVGCYEVQCINLLSGLGGGYTRQEAGAFLVGVLLEAWEQRKAINTGASA